MVYFCMILAKTAVCGFCQRKKSMGQTFCSYRHKINFGPNECKAALGQLTQRESFCFVKFFVSTRPHSIQFTPEIFRKTFISINTWLLIFKIFGSQCNQPSRNTFFKQKSLCAKGNIAQSNWLYEAWVLRKMDALAHKLYYATLQQPALQPTNSISYQT